MIEAKFHLLQIEEKVAAAYPIIPLELGLRKAPKVLNAVDVALFAMGELPVVVDPVVAVPIGDKAVIAPERIRIDRRPFGNTLPDNDAEGFSGDIKDWCGVDPAVSLENTEHNDLSGRTSAALAFPDAPEVRFINLVLPVAGRCLALRCAHDAPADNGVDAVGRVAIDAHLSGSARCRNFKHKISDEFIDGSVVELGPFNNFLSHEHSLEQRIS